MVIRITEDTPKSFAYIKVHKDYTRSEESKFEGVPRFNMMYLPKGVVVGERDLSGGVINPIVMYEDKFNKNMMVAQYDRNHLEDNAITVNLKNEDRTWEKVKVDVDVLAKKVHAVNRDYLRKREEEIELKAPEKKEEVVHEHTEEYTY